MLQTLLSRIPFHPRIPPRVSHALVAIAKFGSGSVILLLLMLASLWYISAPKNSLYLSFSEQISDQSKLTSVAEDIFFRSRTHLGDAFDTNIELSTLISEDTKYTYTSPTYTLDKPNLREIVENMGYKYANESGFYVHFNLVEWLEKLYVRLGWEGRGIEVTGLREEVCPQRTHTNASVTESQNVSVRDKSKCWRITVSFRPATIYSETIHPQTFRGTANELYRDIAVFVMRGIIKDDEVATEEEVRFPILSAESTPTTMHSLKVITRGMEDLMDCTDHACLQRVAESLSTNTDPGSFLYGHTYAPPNPVASLALALVSLQEATIDADYGVPAYPNRIETKLWEMEEHLEHARKSKFIRWAMNNETLPAFRYVHESVPISPQLFLSRLGNKLACALRDYRRARWPACLDKLEEIGLLPKNFSHTFSPSNSTQSSSAKCANPMGQRLLTRS